MKNNRNGMSEQPLNMDMTLPTSTWIQTFTFFQGTLKSAKTHDTKKIINKGFVFVFNQNESQKSDKIFKKYAFSWQLRTLLDSFQNKGFLYFVGKEGPVWIFKSPVQGTKIHHEGILDESPYTFMRDNAGSLVSHFRAHQLQEIFVQFSSYMDEGLYGFLVGLEMAVYQYRDYLLDAKKLDRPKVSVFVDSKQTHSELKSIQAEAVSRALAINISRHLVNLPPNILNPKTFATQLFNTKWPSSMSVEIWDAEKLKKEKMGLHLAVGSGSANPPCLVHLKYRTNLKSKQNAKNVSKASNSSSNYSSNSPSNFSSAQKSSGAFAFVGKGITFDSGGLDIKPSSGMRLMKKDMGGAATLVGLAHWIAHSKFPRDCDFYLALAENSIDKNSFRPSDVFTSRNGLRVEIDNTDAEGRLVLADALDVAVSAQPEWVINVATLTGAIKVALGPEVAGLFSNDDELAKQLVQAGQRGGDPCWRMPLFEKYFSSLHSPFADFKNSSEGFGGAITAALFLQKFIKGHRWAHLDIYSWNDKAQGPFGFSGGNGQGVQLLIEFLSRGIS